MSTDSTAAKQPSSDVKESIYQRVSNMAIKFQFRPGERINEGKLAKQLDVSRTPLREAMQQLVSEKLLRWERNKGFFCRELDEKEVFDLYEYRQLLEEQAVRLACRRATDEQLQEFASFYAGIHGIYQQDKTVANLKVDQTFHEKLARLSDNDEIVNALCNVNQRIYFMRWIDVTSEKVFEPSHKRIVEAVVARNEAEAVSLIGEHVSRRRDEISVSIRQAYGLIYTGQMPTE